MTKPLLSFDLAALHPEALALLFDFDGTLVAIADRPEDVVLADQTMRTLVALRSVLGGAVAVISGRPVHQIDRLLAPYKFAVAGTHGLERRDHNGKYHRGRFDRAALDDIQEALKRTFVGEDGLLFERKPGSVALHYRQRPDLAERCRAVAADTVAGRTDARLLQGKMVVEVKLGTQTKADAVRDFMAVAPFRGRMPVYAGDDVTDEDAFRAVAHCHGTAIKIGPGATTAEYRVPDTEKFLSWLQSLSNWLGGEGSGFERERLPG